MNSVAGVAWPCCWFSSRGVLRWYSILTSRISALWLSDDGLKVSGHRFWLAGWLVLMSKSLCLPEDVGCLQFGVTKAGATVMRLPRF